MSDDTVFARIARILTERLAIEAPSPDVDLFDTGVLDSLSFATLLVGLETEFRMRVPLEEIDLERFRSLRAVAELVGDTMEAAPLASDLP
jgi:acyl carrier protein